MRKEIILMYHSIGGGGNGEVGAGLYSVSIEDFRRQMEYIAEINESQGHKVTRSPVVVTFDDGLLDNYTNAYPILKKFGLKAHFFVLAGKIGAEGYMSWEQIKDLSSAGMVIGSHGMTHRILTELNDEDLDYELRESKMILEERLEAGVDCLSIPRGFYNQKIITMAKEAGYKAVYTSNTKYSNKFIISRISVKRNWGLSRFTYTLNHGLSLKDRVNEFLKTSGKAILGSKKYDNIRISILCRRSHLRHIR
jgi:peptidoglycan/xylan/chitin deacetylase (PgdA/CDA1 family)